jgi:hypothetical protein
MIAANVWKRIATKSAVGGRLPSAAASMNARFFASDVATFDVDGSFEVCVFV